MAAEEPKATSVWPDSEREHLQVGQESQTCPGPMAAHASFLLSSAWPEDTGLWTEAPWLGWRMSSSAQRYHSRGQPRGWWQEDGGQGRPPAKNSRS